MRSPLNCCSSNQTGNFWLIIYILTPQYRKINRNLWGSQQLCRTIAVSRTELTLRSLVPASRESICSEIPGWGVPRRLRNTFTISPSICLMSEEQSNCWKNHVRSPAVSFAVTCRGLKCSYWHCGAFSPGKRPSLSWNYPFHHCSQTDIPFCFTYTQTHDSFKAAAAAGAQ